MPIYEYECEKCGNVMERYFSSWTEGQMIRYLPCPCGHYGNRKISTGNFRVTGANAKNGYSSIPTYDEVVDEHGYARKKWGDK